MSVGERGKKPMYGMVYGYYIQIFLYEILYVYCMF